MAWQLLVWQLLRSCSHWKDWWHMEHMRLAQAAEELLQDIGLQRGLVE